MLRLPELKRHFFLLIYFATSFIVSAQEDVRLLHFGPEQGLSSGAVTCITQDNNGFIWVGTTYGLNRFDGYTFRKFCNIPHDTTSMSEDYVNALLVDGKGTLWIVHQRSIDYYLPGSDKICHFLKFNPPGDLKKFGLVRMTMLSNGNLLLATSTGLALVDTASGKYTGFFGMKSHAPDSLVKYFTGIFTDHKGQVWTATATGELFLLNETHDLLQPVFQLRCDENSEGAMIESMGETEDGILILGSECGLHFFDPISHKERNLFFEGRFEDTLCHCSFRNFMRVGPNRFLIVGQEKLFEVDFNAHRIKHYLDGSTTAEQSFGTPNGFLVDKEGLVWIGDYGAGIFQVNLNAMNFGKISGDENQPDHVINPYVYNFCEDGDSAMAGSNFGMDLISLKTHHVRNIGLIPGVDPRQRPVSVNGIVNGDSGTVWILMSRELSGLAKYNPHNGKMTIYGQDLDLGKIRARSIKVGPDGNFYISTSKKGVLIFDPHTYTFSDLSDRFRKGDTLSSTSVRTTFFDDKGRVWIATRNGLNCFDPATKSMKVYKVDVKDSGSICSNDVMDVTQDLHHVIWISTAYGFCSFDEASGKFRNYDMTDGLVDNFVNTIVPDSLGFIWMSTNQGISRFDPVKGKFKNYTVADGLQNAEFNAGSSYYGRSGFIYFGGVNGFNYFNPGKVRENKTIPAVFISGIQVLGKELATDSNVIFKKRIDLKYGQNFLDFDFTAISYFMPEQNQFACKLEGVDQGWVMLGTRRHIGYPDLAPGDYVLRVKACNNDGYWNEQGTYLIIAIAPPFWRTNWFYIICILSAVFLIWIFIRSREKKLRQEKVVLERKVGERTSELRVEKEKLAEANKDIKDSIEYASRIQAAILPPDKMWKALFKESMLFYKPKDIVAGDFYFLERVDKKIIVAAADCTGHGVPGAMVSVVCSNALSRAVKEFELSDPGKILDKVTQLVLETFEKSESAVNDGMDISLMVIDEKTNAIAWAGANNPLWYCVNGEMKEIKGDKQPIGKFENRKPFNTQSINWSEGMIFYLFTDGFADQFGGPQGKKFKYKQMQEMLSTVSTLPFEKQKEKIDAAFKDWKGNLEQVDDVLVIGIKI